MALEEVTATAYLTPFREGGSMPGLMETDDDGTYVVKFRGAGQGAKVLVSEVIAARLAHTLGLPVPRIVAVHLDAAMAASEPDPDIQGKTSRSGRMTRDRARPGPARRRRRPVARLPAFGRRATDGRLRCA